MSDQITAFQKSITEGYTYKGGSFVLGCGVLNGQSEKETHVALPLKTMNRHGLIAGATGTGKTKTLQLLAEGLSDASIPVVLMDIKGDLSGIAAAGVNNERIRERLNLIGEDYTPASYPVELMTLSADAPGVRLRSTVSEFGPVLLSRILGLNDTQQGVMAMIFKFCDDTKMPLIDLKDVIKVIQYISDEGKETLEKNYGKIATSSTGTILRKVIELQQQGADAFFGEPSFDVDDFMRISDDGRGKINIIRVMELQDRPKLFSTFMLSLLAELYAALPEAGDLDQPKLCLFIDEAHLVFQEANEALLQQLETVVKLIRSKGVGIFFCTQNPQDIPASVLAQLGLKIQHALRAFTAADRKVIRQAAENYPETDYYDVDALLTQLGIGEAFVTVLNEKGIPAPLVHTMLRPPRSRMDVLSENEIRDLVAGSKLVKKYATTLDSESAYEIISAKLEEAAVRSAQGADEKESSNESRPPKEESIFDHPVVRQIGRTAASIITRSLLGALGLGGRSRRKRLF